MPPTGLISLSIAPATALVGKRYYDLAAMLSLMRRLTQDGLVDGFEFQHLAEWEATGPPRDEAARRLAAWHDSPKYTVEAIGATLRRSGLPILSVHANRDVGILLCSDEAEDVRNGVRLLRESLALAREVGAPVCVFHLWDTSKQRFDPASPFECLDQVAGHFPEVKAAVENVPTRLQGHTPFALAQRSRWVTLDLKWAALYDELERFEAIKDRLANVHLRGRLEGNVWSLPDAPFGFYEALNLIREQWGYDGLMTMEPDGLRQTPLDGFSAAIRSLRLSPHGDPQCLGQDVPA